ncbi:MAG: hypothetical protein A3H68_03230 [Candidatus Taylorbacteria bacterium RIFCSPLOWO2_02_FULL_46_40]|uniref:Methyltransferase type 11 domain-containing protein n=1 Tax=Candidatus Taylorbacteria bacterium RIFCSPLOWO2_02_FULL_46_40 TaxID=1802329 RepID=A0A1G2P301_9BACT|nr:MAG: hypothetical protein A3H68_03230 [Candidatus Taylorbacteria bacterium RIFCSPLOWO2_02_FULL_46_40]
MTDGKLFFTNPPEDARELIEKPANKNKWSKERWFAFDYFKQRLASEDTKEKVLCDIGVGTGPYRELTTPFSNFFGVDFFPYSPVDIVADLRKPLPIADNSCDIILCSEVLEHLPNPGLFVKEMGRIIRPGGYGLVSVPFLHVVHYAPYDFYRYTNFGLEYLFKEAGFSSIEIVNVGTPFDVYHSFEERFFSAYFLSYRFSNNKLVNTLIILWGRAIRKIINLLWKTVSHYTKAMPSSTETGLAFCLKVIK